MNKKAGARPFSHYGFPAPIHLCKTETGRPPDLALGAQCIQPTTSGFWGGFPPTFTTLVQAVTHPVAPSRRSKPELRLKCQSMANSAQPPDCFHSQAGSNQNPNASPFLLPGVPHCSALLPTTARATAQHLLRLLSATEPDWESQ